MKLRFLVVLAAGLGGQASADSLADIRQDLANLLLVTDRLQLEMLTTPGIDFSNEGSLLERTSVIEGELQRLTGASEESAIPSRKSNQHSELGLSKFLLH